MIYSVRTKENREEASVSDGSLKGSMSRLSTSKQAVDISERQLAADLEETVAKMQSPSNVEVGKFLLNVDDDWLRKRFRGARSVC